MSKTLILDWNRCVGCGACAITCMDQNDIFPEKGQPPFRRIYQLESESEGGAVIQYVSAGCKHCTDSPCLVGCPTGAIYRDDRSQAILVDADRCIGCHSCALACPFGVPRYDAEDKMRKCNLCTERLAAGMQPACVKVCPFGALRYEEVDALQGGRERRYFGNLLESSSKAGI